MTAADHQRAWEQWRGQLQRSVSEVERVWGRELRRELRDLRRDVARLDRKLSPQ